MQRTTLQIISLLAIHLLQCGNDPNINFPPFEDPAFITRENYDFGGGIGNLRNYCRSLGPGKTLNLGMTAVGIVLNSYDSVTHGVYYDKGFFIQDENAAIFVRSKENISVKRGDKIQLNVVSAYRSSCSSCSTPFEPRIQIKNYTIQNTISTDNLIYCIDLTPDTEYDPLLQGPCFVKAVGRVSKKNSDTAASWGMDQNLWGIRFPVENERSFPDVYPGDEIVAYGVIESYGKVADGEVEIPYPLWVYDSRNCIFDFSLE